MDIRDVAIIDSLPVWDCPKIILSVGCGNGRIDKILCDMGYTVYATDYENHSVWPDKSGPIPRFSKADIFDLKTFPVLHVPIVICSEVLEHLVDYKEALKNLLILTEIKLIITIPFKKSFNNDSPPPVGHCNHWDDNGEGAFKDIREFHRLCHPYTVSMSKIRTKPRDVEMNQWAYLIAVDKRQKYGQ